MVKKLSILILFCICAFAVQAGTLRALHGKIPGGYNFWLYTPGASKQADKTTNGSQLAAEEEAPDGYDDEALEEEALELEVISPEELAAELQQPYTPSPDDEEDDEPDIDTNPDAKPLIVFLHGASLSGNDLNKVKRYGTIYAVEHGRDLDAYVVAPQVSSGGWRPAKVMEVVDYVVAHHNVDTSRIYVLGMSLGGYGTLDFAATYPDRIAAAIAMCGGATVKNLDGLAQMPLWIIHGTGDSAVSVSQSDKVVSAVKDAQTDGVNRLSYDRVPGMNHGKPARLFCNQEIYDWLLSHSLDDEGRPMTDTPSVSAMFGSSYKGIKHSKSSTGNGKASKKTSKSGKSSKKSKSAKSSKSSKKKTAKKK